MRALWILTIAVGIASVALLLLLRADRPRAATLVAAPAAPAKPYTAGEPQPVWTRPVRTPSVAAPGLGVIAEAEDLLPATAQGQAALRAQQQRERVEQRARIRAAMEREPRDLTWATKLETELRGSVAQAVRVARLESVECRSSLCAVVMTHPHADAQTESMTALAGAPGFRLAGTAHLEHGGDGRFTTHVFLVRGYDRFPRY